MTERSVRFRTPPDTVEVVHSMLAQLWEDRPDVEAMDRFAFETAVVELAGNVVQHGSSATAIVCTLGVTVDEVSLRALLVDTADPPGIDSGPREMPDVLAESGRGLALIHALVTTFEYERSASRNVWSLCKDRSAAAE
ncbi:ATP-binding protein [Rathayibacter sp. VKM Ac-2804]|uniref:ATP-binding protein n=1 Tax=Rathayibacter sp. VKM Ac-2804 TaxID=2609257 RepID=UPI001FCA0A65|nr:ATP-binding protein [Rathayibacter sp. VKM Ac-2804]